MTVSTPTVQDRIDAYWSGRAPSYDDYQSGSRSTRRPGARSGRRRCPRRRPRCSTSAPGFRDVTVTALTSILQLDREYGVAPDHGGQLQYLVRGRGLRLDGG
jgi:hypothetical protein